MTGLRTTTRWAAVAIMTMAPAAVVICVRTAEADSLGTEFLPLVMAGDPNGSPADLPSDRIDPNVAASPFAGVGSIKISLDATNSALASGFVVGPNKILTAAHPFDRDNDGVRDIHPSTVKFNLNVTGDLSHVFTVSQIDLHQDFGGFLSTTETRDDLAIMTLSTNVPAGVPQYGLYESPVAVPERITMVGYGQSGSGVGGALLPASETKKRTGENDIDLLGLDDENPGSGSNEVWTSDFDDRDGLINFLGGTTLGNGIETTPFMGDSGAPAFVFDPITGEYLAAGVVTFATTFFDKANSSFGPPPPRFGSGAGGVLLHPYLDFIRGAIGPATDPVIPLPPAAWAALPLLAGLGMIRTLRRMRPAA